MEERRPIAIQQAIRDPRRSAVGKYQDLVVGSRSVLRLLLHELVITTTSWIPGALGLVLRRICYPWLLGAVGRNVTFGAGVVLRHPAKIRLASRKSPGRGRPAIEANLSFVTAKSTIRLKSKQ